MATNVIRVSFGATREVRTSPAYQWDYGQVLEINGVPNLPSVFQTHFSNQQTGGIATTVTGTNGKVTIPNHLLTTAKTVYAWIYVNAGDNDGETEYAIIIPVKARPMPEYYDVGDPGVFDDVVEQVREYYENADDAATRAEESATAAAASANNAAGSATAAAGSAAAAEQAKDDAVTAKGQAETAAQTAMQKAQQTAQDAEQAASDAGRAESAAQRAETAQTGAESAVLAAEAAARDAAASASAASASATSAGQAASAAAQSASAAAQSAASIEGDVQTASQKAAEAQTAAGQAVTAKDAAVTAQTAAETAATNAGQSASTATTKATEAAQSASGAAQSKTAAEAAATRAEQAAASLVVDPTLTVSGAAADAKVVGDNFTNVKNAIDTLKSQIEPLLDLPDRVHQLERVVYDKRYGVSGIGQSASALTRLWDSVGMTAEVGTDGDNSAVVNDFDHAAPFMRRKCVGEWSLVNGHAEFTVNAYYGDSDYAEDGTKGDYVAVECPLSYYYFSDGVLGVSSYKHPGFRPFDIFCRNHDEDDLMEYYYLPAYALAEKDGKAVSLPDLDNYQGSYKQCLDAARTYKNGAVGNLAVIQPAAVNFYEWALATVEFAQQNHQKVMNGCCSLRHNGDDRVTFTDATHVLTSNYQAGRVAGEYILITATSTDINIVSQQASHKIVSIIRCDENGNEDASGTHQLIEVDDLGKAYVTYDTTGLTEYRIAARPYRTGSCNSVSTPSGSPVSNSDGYHPMKYRWRENVYANQYKTIVDLFNKRVGTGYSDWILEHYYLPNPENYTPANNNKPDATDLATDDFVKLDVETSHANYVNGYIKTRVQSALYPDIWIPGETTGGSGTTYFADFAHLVHSYAVRSVRLGGHWYNDAFDGFSFFHGYLAPSFGYAIYGGDLCFIQTGEHEGASPS